MEFGPLWLQLRASIHFGRDARSLPIAALTVDSNWASQLVKKSFRVVQDARVEGIL